MPLNGSKLAVGMTVPFSLDSLSNLYQDTLLLLHGYCCIQDSVLWVPMKHRRKWKYNTHNSLCLTWFTFNASPRYAAPSSSILLHSRCSVVRTCNQRWEWECIRCHGQFLTWFNLSALPRYRAPLPPIVFGRKIECCECLCSPMWIRMHRISYPVSHFVHHQRYSEIPCTFRTDIIVLDLQCL